MYRRTSLLAYYLPSVPLKGIAILIYRYSSINTPSTNKYTYRRINLGLISGCTHLQPRYTSTEP